MEDEGIPKGTSGRRRARTAGRFGPLGADADAGCEPSEPEFEGDRWEMCDPRRNEALHPYNDADSVEVLDGAVTTLVFLRAPMWLGDAAVTTSVLASLAGEAEGRLHDAVADARDQDYSWEEIARRLGTSVSSARRRYGGAATPRRKLIFDASEAIIDRLMIGDDR